MKRLRSTGLGVSVKQAEPITIDEENQLWEKGVLGDHSPQSLVDTMLFLCGLNFALRSREEHRSLQVSQFTLTHSPSGSLQLEYTENYSKNNAGGLAHRKVQPKHVLHHANDANPKRCLVRLYQAYMSHRPSEAKTDAFYLTPLKKPKGNVWYSKTPIGHNTLNTTISRICKAAGVTGYKTNHSLRVTTATRLFQKGVEEQLIMSRTGHRSVEGVRTYHRIGDEQRQMMSDILNEATNGEEETPSSKRIKVVPSSSTSSPTHVSTTSNTVNSIQANSSTSSASFIPSIHFTGCSAVTVNFTINKL